MIRKKVTEGVFIYQYEREFEGEKCFCIDVHNQLMYNVKFEFNFDSSKHIKLKGEKASMGLDVVVPPLQRRNAVTLQLSQSWTINATVKYTLELAEKEVVQALMMNDINKLIMLSEKMKTYKPKDVDLYKDQIHDCIERLAEDDMDFIDLEFPPSDLSITRHPKIIKEFQYVIHWRKPHEFHNEGEIVFYDTLHPTNLTQFYQISPEFISALYCLAEYPEYIERIVETKNYNRKMFRCRLCDSGTWETVTVDCYFPYKPRGGPLFVYTKGYETWAQIIEKAYAKRVGDYFSISDVPIQDILFDLTGCPVDFIRYDSRVDNEFMNDAWVELLSSLSKRHLVLFTKRILEDPKNDPNNDESKYQYCYPVVYATEIKDTKIIQIRDPLDNEVYRKNWGQNLGFFSDDPRLNNGPTKKLLKDQDGSLVMPFTEVFRLFDTMIINKLENWEDLRLLGRFISFKDYNDPKFRLSVSKWYYTVEVEYSLDFYIYVHQESFARDFVPQYRPIMTCCILAYEVMKDGSFRFIKSSSCTKKKRVCLNMKLNPGKYAFSVMTPCCRMRKHEELVGLQADIVDDDGDFTPKMIDLLKQLFKRYDIMLDGYLGYFEFGSILQAFYISLTELQFKDKVLNKYGDKTRGIDFEGFKLFFKDLYLQSDEDVFRLYLKRLGFDSSLFCGVNRNFIISFHSQDKVNIIRRDALTECIFLENFISLCFNKGEIIEEVHPLIGGIKMACYHKPETECYIYCCTNDTDEEALVIFDLTNVKNAVRSHPHRRVFVPPRSRRFIAMFEHDGFSKGHVVLKEDFKMILARNRQISASGEGDEFEEESEFGGRENLRI